MPGQPDWATIRSEELMNPQARRAIAYIAGRACIGSDADGILDLETGEHALLEGRLDTEVAVYDHSRNCLVGGSTSELHDGGTQAWVNLEISGGSFSGFDHASNHPFGGRAEGEDVWIFDCEVERRFSYVLTGVKTRESSAEVRSR
jgi:hypothetical protein